MGGDAVMFFFPRNQISPISSHPHISFSYTLGRALSPCRYIFVLMSLFLSAAFALAAFVAGPGDEEAVDDFEETPAGDAIAAGWERVSSPSHPSWNRIERVRDPRGAASGEHFLRMTGLGDSTAIQMQREHAWKIDPSRSYRMSVQVRIDAPGRNVAGFTVIWLDGHHREVGQAASPTLRRSEGWRTLSLDLTSIPPGTAWAVVRLSLDGPDVRGECSFDRLTLSRPVRLRLSPLEGSLPILESRRSSRFRLQARELPEGRHRAAVTLKGPDGSEKTLVDQEIRSDSSLDVPVPPLAPGAYALTARLAGSEREWTLLVRPAPWLAEPGQVPLVSGAFDFSGATYRDVPALAELAGFRRIRVAIWPNRARELMLELSRAGSMTMVGSLEGPPPELFPEVDPALLEKGMAAVRSIDPRLWEPQVRELVRKYREFVPLWQIGATVVRTDALLNPGAGEPVVTIDSPDPAELVRLIVLSAGAGAAPIFVSADRLLDEEGYPKAGFLAVRVANDVLSGAKPRPDLVSLVGAPVRAAFEKDGRAILVAWTEKGESEFSVRAPGEVASPLGSVRPLTAGERLRAGPMPLFIGKVDPLLPEERVTVQLVDPADASMSAALPLGAEPSSRVLRIRNRSRRSGLSDLHVTFPEPLPRGWVVRPLKIEGLSLPPGQELTPELTILLPPTEQEGERSLEVELRFVQAGRPQVVREKLPIRIVPQIDIDVQITEAPGLTDAKRVSVRVTNRTSVPRTLTALVRLPGRPERSEPLGTLEPRSSAERTLDYLVRDLRLIDPTRLKVEVLVEERSGDRLHSRKTLSLK